jgi:hypothetical protein
MFPFNMGDTMSDLNRGRSGWYVPRPGYVLSPPKDRSDLLQYVENVTGTQVPQVVFDSEEEAERESVKLLKALRRDAIFQEKYASDLSNNLKRRDRENQLQDARKYREIADAGLKLLGIQLADDDDGFEFTAV